MKCRIALIALIPIFFASNAYSQSPLNSNASNFAGTRQSDVAQMQDRATLTLLSATDANGKPIPAILLDPNKPVRLRMSGNSFSIELGCNNLFGELHLEKKRLKTYNLGSTIVDCFSPPEVVAHERAILKHLMDYPRIFTRLASPSGGFEPKLYLKRDNGDTLEFAL